MPLRPEPNTLLRDLPLPALTPYAEEQLARSLAFLWIVNRPEHQARALLAGYTPELHRTGFYLATHVAGLRSFGEWRLWYALRPPRDPDLPEEVAELDRFVARWLPRVRAVCEEEPDPENREELLDYAGSPRDRRSRTWRAKSWVQLVEHIGKVPMAFYQRVWEKLVAQGLCAELVRVHEVLESIQKVIETAPLDAAELADIQAMREAMAPHVAEWLTARRAQFEGHFPGDTLTLLALGELVPPPLPEVDLQGLAHFTIAARG